MSKSLAEPERLQMTISRMRVARWISKATRARAHKHTHARKHAFAQPHTKICNSFCLSTATMVLSTRLSVALYVYCLYFYPLYVHCLYFYTLYVIRTLPYFYTLYVHCLYLYTLYVHYLPCRSCYMLMCS